MSPVSGRCSRSPEHRRRVQPREVDGAGAFPNVSVGPAWWFNDSPFEMEHQLEYVSSVDLLANHAGMVSDSRKLLSFGSRFEMFRRSLVNVFGGYVDRGRMPMDVAGFPDEHVVYDARESFLASGSRGRTGLSRAWPTSRASL